MIIKNYKLLAKNKQRRICLSIIDHMLSLLQPSKIINQNIKISNYKVIIGKNIYDLNNFENIYLIGIGKGSLNLSLQVIKIIKKIKAAYIIDVEEKNYFRLNKNINFTKGDHPLPSINNFRFSKKIIDKFYGKLSENDLIFVVICGGGSAMLVYPYKISLNKYININQQLLRSGANIYEMNIVRKHLDLMKGGGLAKILYPAKIISLILSDVPENDLSFIASGPTVKDRTSINEALRIIKKYKLKGIDKNYLIETIKDEKYFRKVDNILILNNLIILRETKKFIENKFKLKVKILSNKLIGEVNYISQYLLKKIIKSKNNILLLGGETTVKVKGKGQGGRNQELVLRFLKYLKEKYQKEKDKFLIISVNSDGWDNTKFAGAIGDYLTLKKAEKLKLDINKFLLENDSFNFFKKTGDGLITGRLPINIADLILVYKNK